MTTFSLLVSNNTLCALETGTLGFFHRWWCLCLDSRDRVCFGRTAVISVSRSCLLEHLFHGGCATELIVSEAAEGNGEAEELDAGDGVVEEEHGCEDDHDVLENARQGENEGRGFADLRDAVSLDVQIRK